MFKRHISQAAFLSVIMAATSAFADDSSLSQSVNDLSQQLQNQQQEINRLKLQLKQKDKTGKTSAAANQSAAQQQSQIDTSSQQKPGVVAPLAPTSLGTLRVQDLTHPGTVAPTTQIQMVQAPVAQLPVNPPLVQSQAVSSVPATNSATTAVNTSVAPAHVGEAPPTSTKPPEVQALASVGGVLTPYGRMVIEPFLQYSRSSTNTFAFDGVQTIPAFLIGTVVANQTGRDLIESGATVRLGLSDRFEAEVRVPFVYRSDSFVSTIPNTQNTFNSDNASGAGLGDVEVAGHYQINQGKNDWPFFIANLRFKSDTGTSPYTVAYNKDGSEHTLATGSGFMAVEPSITAIYPTDPATLFANVGYIHSFGYNVDHLTAGSFINDVDPGDTYIASLGLGVALNDKLSFTLGYEHDYVMPTYTVINGTPSNSVALQMGSALSGLSYRLNDRSSINLSLAAGVTPDAPNVVVGVRVPIALQAF